MPKLKASTSQRTRTTSVNVLQQNVTPRRSAERGLPPSSTCVVPTCDADPEGEDMPVVLCPKHLRETYQYAQGLIEDRLIKAAVSIM